MNGSLDGIRVLDLTRHMAGPYASLMLADHGADVVKLESIDGDPSRRTGVDFVGDQSAVFLMWNRGKRSIAADLRTPEGLEIAHRLAARADVVLENYRPGQADRFGLGYDDLSSINDRLIYVSISAFGQTGPLAPYPGTDPVVQAASGVMSVTGEPDRGPALVGVPIADFSGALGAVQGVLLALLARARTGRGQRVDVSLLDMLLSSLTTRLATHWATGEDPQRYGSAHSIVMPYEAFPTADGHAVAGVWGGNDGWEPFCRVVGLPELAQDPRYRTNQQRVAARQELREVLAERFATRTTAQWEADFHREGVLFSPVHRFSQILGHPQVTSAETVQTVDHPTLGPLPMLAPPVRLHETPGRIGSAPPLLGQHTREILHELGYDDVEVSALVADGLVRAAPEG